jgi:hypothetical protein
MTGTRAFGLRLPKMTRADSGQAGEAAIVAGLTDRRNSQVHQYSVTIIHGFSKKRASGFNLNRILCV